VRNSDKLSGITHQNLTTVKAELADEAAMENAVKGQDAVMIALGGKGIVSRDTTCSVGTRHIINAMNKTGVKRMIVCSSYGVGPGNRALLGWAIRAMLYHPLADKDEQEADIQKSGLDYTIVRPPRLVDKPARGEWFHTVSGTLPHMEIARADVASFMLSQLKEDTYINQCVSVAWKTAQQ
jgi:putative NADH-flavin reductase